MEKDIFKQRRQMLADMILNNELYVPMKAKEIAMLLDIPKAKRSELMEVLDSLVADGTIGVSKKGKYMKPENVALVGTFESTSRGFGFVVIPDREDDSGNSTGKSYALIIDIMSTPGSSICPSTSVTFPCGFLLWLP